MTKKKPLTPGNAVAIFTPSYHYTGRVVEVTALHIYLDEVIMYVDIGQILAITKGGPEDAYGDPLPGITEIPRPSAQSTSIAKLPLHEICRG